MKKLITILLLLITVSAVSQVKTVKVTNSGGGSADSATFKTNYDATQDSLALVTAINLKKDKSDSVYSTGYATQYDLKKTSDSLQTNITTNSTDIALKKNNSDSVISTGYATQYDLTKTKDSLQTNIDLKKDKSDSVYSTGYSTQYDLTKTKDSLQTNIDLKQNLSGSSYTFRANNTTATANYSEHVYRDSASGAYTGSITWTGTPPSGSEDKTFVWKRIGNIVFFDFKLIYGTAGASITEVVFALQTGMPAPFQPAGVTGSNKTLTAISGMMPLIITAGSTVSNTAKLIITSGGVASISVTSSSGARQYVFANGFYSTN